MPEETKPVQTTPHRSPDGQQRRPPRRSRRQEEADALGLKETVVAINRVAKVVKGGKRFSFGALVVVGDGKGSVGFGLGKAKDVQFSIQKGSLRARKNMFHFAMSGDTIPHETVGRWGAGKVWMKPAAPGTGVIAGGGVRAVLEAAGVKNILTKSLGSSNNFSVIYATMQALKALRTREDIAKLRGR
ncbi:MAG: 30S ribosomal protein S5 [Elusimicrobiota bacterium]|jgi:small subunit ribosomal protein S5